jgi:hypothetical protein
VVTTTKCPGCISAVSIDLKVKPVRWVSDVVGINDPVFKAPNTNPSYTTTAYKFTRNRTLLPVLASWYPPTGQVPTYGCMTIFNVFKVETMSKIAAPLKANTRVLSEFAQSPFHAHVCIFGHRAILCILTIPHLVRNHLQSHPQMV